MMLYIISENTMVNTEPEYFEPNTWKKGGGQKKVLSFQIFLPIQECYFEPN